MNRRIEYMDALRIVSALSVVLIHAVNPVTFSYALIPTGSWWLSNVLNILGRASVPLFVMLSGALLLDRSRQAESPLVMFKKRLSRIIVIYAVWSAIYFLWRAFGLHQSLTFSTIIDSLIAGTPGEQLYFLPLIAGLYAVTPLLRAAVWTLPLRQVVQYTILLLLMAAGWQYLGSFPGHTPSYNLFNQFVPFVGYYLLGFVLTQISWQPRPWLMFSLYGAGVVIPSALTYLFVSRIVPVNTPYYMYDFVSPFIALQAVGAWLIVQRYYPALSRRLPSLQRSVHATARATLSLYLVHVIVLQFIASYIIDFPAAERPLHYILFQVVGGGAAAVIIAYSLTRIPGIKKLVT